MRFALALLATSAAALELPSTFFNGTGANSATNWATYVKSGLTSAADISYTTSKFNNRFGGRGMWPTQTLGGKINDRSGFVAGAANANRALNMNWFGGCYFKPSKIMEEYFNDLVAGKRFHFYTAPTQTTPDKMPEFQNRHLSGYATYRCMDAAPGTDDVPTTTSTTTCEIGAKATGFKWDMNQSQAGVKMELWRPFMYIEDATDGANIKAFDEHRYLDENCIPIKDTDSASALATPGTINNLVLNQFIQGAAVG